MANNISQYLIGDAKEFPLGSIVFFYSPCSILQYKGISHVGIVVGYKNGSPQIAHATYSNNTQHALISRLLAYEKGDKREYIVVKPLFDNQKIANIVDVAKKLSTTEPGDPIIVPYSLERSQSMNTYTRTLYHQFSSINDPIEKFASIMNTQLKYCAEVFALADDNRQPSWLNSFSKMLNMRKIDTALSQKTKKNKKSWNEKSNLLTQKGMHCVQFVTTVFQIAELHESQYQTFYKVPHSFEHFSLKHGNTSKTKSPYVLEKFHNAFSCFKEHYFPQSLIPLSGKKLSPAALLMYFSCPPNNHSGKKFFIQSSIPSCDPRFEQLILSLKAQTFVDQKEVSRNIEAKELDTTALLSTLCMIKKQESETKQRIKKGRKRKNVEKGKAILYSKSNSVVKKSSQRKRFCLAASSRN